MSASSEQPTAPSTPTQPVPSFCINDTHALAFIRNGLLGFSNYRCPISGFNWHSFFPSEAAFRDFLKRWKTVIGNDGTSMWLRVSVRDLHKLPHETSVVATEPNEAAVVKEFDFQPLREAIRSPPPSTEGRLRLRLDHVPQQEATARRSGIKLAPQTQLSPRQFVPQQANKPAISRSVDDIQQQPSKNKQAQQQSKKEKYNQQKIQRLETKLEKTNRNLVKFRTNFNSLVNQMACTICMEPSAVLYENACCACIVCERCSQLKRPCPDCHRTCTWRVSPIVTRIVSQLKIDCPLECGEETTYGDLERHKGEFCLSAIVNCPHANCHVKVRRRNMEKHCNEECQYREELCDPKRCRICAERIGEPLSVSEVENTHRPVQFEEEQLWFLIDEGWWQKFVQSTSKGAGMKTPPGPISNKRLFKDEGKLKSDLRLYRDYRGITAEEWEYVESTFGGGPAIARHELDIYAPSAHVPSDTHEDRSDESDDHDEAATPRSRAKQRRRRKQKAKETMEESHAEGSQRSVQGTVSSGWCAVL